MISNFSYAVMPQYVYITKSKSEKNVVELNITNYSSEPITFNNPNELSPDEYPEYDEEIKISNPSGFYIYFNYGNNSGDIGTKEENENIHISTSSNGWEVSEGLESDTVGIYWIVAPTKTINLGSHENVTLKISDIKCNKKEGQTPIHIEFRTDGNKYLDMIEIYKMSKLDYDLIFKSPSDGVTVQNEDSLDLIIENNSSFPLVFNNSEKHTPEQYPEYDDFNTNDSSAGFYIYFNYGDMGGDITTEADSKNISLSVKDKKNWKVFSAQSPTVGTYWKVCPIETTQMEAHECLNLHFGIINTNAEAGVTPLYIELRADKKILPERIDFFKFNKPIINSFAPKKTDYNINEKVTFNWDIKYGDECRLTINTTNVTNLKEYTFNIADIEYELNATNKAGFSVTKKFIPSFQFIDYFKVIDCDEKSVTLQWSAKNCSSCEIDGIGKVDINGKAVISAEVGSKKDLNFTLKAHQLDSYKIHEKTIKFGYPKITTFRFCDRYYSPQATQLDLIEGSPFISLEEINRLSIVPVITVPYDGYSPKEYHYGLEWDGEHIYNYELVGYSRFTGGGYKWYEVRDRNIRHYKLRAYGISDKIYDEKGI